MSVRPPCLTNAVCRIDGCIEAVFIKKRGLCQRHYRNLKRRGHELADGRAYIRGHGSCSVCGEPANGGRGLCPNHYKQWQYRQHPEKYKAWETQRRLREGDRIRAEDRLRYRRDPAAYKAGSARRKARVRGATGSHTRAEWEALLAEHDGKCAYCPELATTRDHVVPISRGGTDYIDNIAPACFSCNASKQDKLLSEWAGRPSLLTR